MAVKVYPVAKIQNSRIAMWFSTKIKAHYIVLGKLTRN
jgi:transposase-like protein